jgi:hypothetical protein
MNQDMECIAERTRAELGIAYADAIMDENEQRSACVSLPDMHVAMLEGVARFAADVVLAGRDAGSTAARVYLAEWIVERVREQMATAERGGMVQ